MAYWKHPRDQAPRLSTDFVATWGDDKGTRLIPGALGYTVYLVVTTSARLASLAANRGAKPWGKQHVGGRRCGKRDREAGLEAAWRDGTVFATLQQALATAQPPVDVDVWWCTLGAEVAVLSESCTAGQLHRLPRFAMDYYHARGAP